MATLKLRVTGMTCGHCQQKVQQALKQANDTTLIGQMPTYQNPTVPIMTDVSNAIADWILRLRS